MIPSRLPSFLLRLSQVVLIGGNLVLGLSTLVGAAPTPVEKQPNVIVILTDDVGVGTIGCYGADPRMVRTPHIDRLAAEGRRFTAASTPASVCSPTRYALLTGRYCWRTGALSSVYSVMDPLKIETTRPTIASILKAKGYTTAVVGKWHLGLGNAPEVDYTKPLTPGPLDVGFDYDFLISQNHGDITGVYIENDRVVGLRSDKLIPVGKSFYGKDYIGLDAPQRKNEEVMQDLTNKAVTWLGKQSAAKPFFMLYAPVALHEPITPSAKNAGKSGCGPYGDFAMDLDDSVGEIMAELKRSGLDQNTVVLFTSDNGAESAKTKDKAIEAGLLRNGTWRGWKHGIYEGGLRVPYIVRWPGKVPAGTQSDQMVNVLDTMATVAAISGAQMPPETVSAEDSVNVLRAWLGTAKGPVRKAMIVNSEDGVFAVRQGPWKWIEGKPDPERKFPDKFGRRNEFKPQLYNLQDDPAETKNLISQHPELVQELSRLLNRCRDSGYSGSIVAAPEDN